MPDRHDKTRVEMPIEPYMRVFVQFKSDTRLRGTVKSIVFKYDTDVTEYGVQIDGDNEISWFTRDEIEPI